eukprot:NODE_88_length_21932_cov_0.317867.p16 type:complete len:117 gc:universal NODE_88_length_21932_cov_0.317867:2140-1790(-)
MSAPISKSTTALFIDILQKGPKTMQELYQLMPNLSHCTIKRKLVKPLKRFEVIDVKLNSEVKTFYINLKKIPPFKYEQILEETERNLKPLKLNLKWDFQKNRQFTKDIGVKQQNPE